MRMNKKGAGFQTFINAATILGVMYFIIFIIFGAGGGFKAAFDIGQFVAKIPVIFWVGLAVVWLLAQLRR